MRNNISRNYQDIQALNPENEKLFGLKLSNGRMHAVAQRGEGAVCEMAHIVTDTLVKPKAIFQGLCRDEDEPHNDYSLGWLCYSAIPTNAYLEDGRVVAPWKDQVFLVYVNDDKVVYNWRWDIADKTNLFLPIGFQTKFKKKAWPHE